MEMIIVCLSLLTLLAFLFLKSLLKQATKLNQPPSPWRLPVIGNLHQLSQHPHRSFYSLSLRYGPLMLLHIGRVPILVVSSADTAHDVMKTHDVKFANRHKSNVIAKFLKGGGDLVFSPYGEHWRQLKSLCVMHLLSKKMVLSFEKVREEEIKVMMKQVDKATISSSPVNLSELLTALTSDVICRVALGRKYSGLGEEEGGYNFKKIVREVMELAGTFPLDDYIPCLAWIDRFRGLYNRVEEASNKIDSFLERAVQEHVADHANKERPDFVDISLSIQRDKTIGFELGRTELKNIILDLFLAGTSTTFALIEWTMTELIRHPECMKKLRDEICLVSMSNLYVNEEEVEKMKYLKAVIMEGARLHPSLPLIPRLLSEDVKIKGYDIAAGTQVLTNVWAIQRDNATWGPDAEEFRPERQLDSPLDFQGHDLKYIPFGSGRRLCPGMRSGLALAEVTLANLVKWFYWRVEIRPLGYDKLDLVEAAGADVCRKFPLVVFPSFA